MSNLSVSVKGERHNDLRTVAILICTYNRHDLLHKLLEVLVEEVERSIVVTSAVVVVDGGENSAEELVSRFRTKLALQYVKVSKPGLSAARNLAFERGRLTGADLLALIDDDEVPEFGWLDALREALVRTGAGFATGPVRPYFASDSPPKWACSFFSKTGRTFCTSNLVIRSADLPHHEYDWFCDSFAFTGGEDNEFLNRLASRGVRHAVAERAVVREFIPDKRLSYRYVMWHGMRDGTVISQKLLLVRTGRVALSIRIAGVVVTKLCHAAGHLVSSLFDTQHLYLALDDFCCASGALARSLGFRFEYYGKRGKLNSTGTKR